MLSSARLGMAEGFITMNVISVWLPAGQPACDWAALADADLYTTCVKPVGWTAVWQKTPKLTTAATPA